MTRVFNAESFMEEGQSFDAVIGRIMSVTHARSDSALARALDIQPQSVAAARKRQQIPPAWIVFLSQQLRVRTDWLFFGIGPVYRDDPEPPAMEGAAAKVAGTWSPPVLVRQPVEEDPWKSAKWQEVPVVGLANCGTRDWYAPGPLALRLTLPVDYPYSPEMFAVIAVGNSMQYEGIYQGFVVYCDPMVPVKAGDVVYVEKNDGTAAIKKYLKRDNERLHLQGWSEPKPDGTQTPYYEEVENAQVRRMSCVVVVKRKG